MSPYLLMLSTTLLAIASPARAATFFPESLQGQWTDNLSNCGGEDTGGMLVSAQSIQFYEAEGTPTSVGAEPDGTITAHLTYRGEGKTWTEFNRYEISKDKASVRVHALGRTFTLQRCV